VLLEEVVFLESLRLVDSAMPMVLLMLLGLAVGFPESKRAWGATFLGSQNEKR
jgi:hypothetical protein